MADRDSLKAAMHAHTHLTILEAVIAALEGAVYGGDKSMDRAVGRIIAIAKQEQQRQLTKMDNAAAFVKGENNG